MYNPQNAQERAGLPQDMVFEGVITTLDDRKVKDFVQKTEKWKNPEQSAIKIGIEVMHNGRAYRFEKIFTYTEENGVTVFNPKSDMGKFNAKYGTLPKIGNKVKVVTNKEGYMRVKLD